MNIFFVQIPGFILDPVVFCSICYFIVGLRKDAYHFCMTVVTVVFTANVASACGRINNNYNIGEVHFRYYKNSNIQSVPKVTSQFEK